MDNARESIPTVPRYLDLMWPTLLALKALGDSGSIQEIDDKASEIAHLSDAQLSQLHNDGPQTKVKYRMAWARSYLKSAGAIENSNRGIWSITDYGRVITQAQVAAIPGEKRAAWAEKRRAKLQTEVSLGDELTQDEDMAGPDEDGSIVNWRTQLLSILQAMHPGSFEKLCQRVLRESGFTSVAVTGRSGDGGIDGVGVLRIALLSFQVFFQCKRYKGNVGASAIRDFRGAMVGRTDKGLFITTGSFTPDAKREATRDGAPVLDLIDGESLCDLLQKHQLGVGTKMVEQVLVDADWFGGI